MSVIKFALLASVKAYGIQADVVALLYCLQFNFFHCMLACSF